MIALDTNVLVRYLVNDDARQAQVARDLLANLTADNPGFICREIAVELSWVLERYYGFSRDQIASVFEDVVRKVDGCRWDGAQFPDRMIAVAAARFDNALL